MGRHRERRPVRLRKPVIVAATTTVALTGAGTGTALASTSDSSPHGHSMSLASHENGKCVQAEAAALKADKDTIRRELPSLYYELYVEGATDGGASVVLGPADLLATLADAGIFTIQQAKTLGVCDPGLFEGNGTPYSNIPHPPIPTRLKKAEQGSRNRLQGGTSGD